MKSFFNLLFAALLILTSCGEVQNSSNSKSSLKPEESPKWAQEAIWYQVFIERFRNGDQSNDPKLQDILVSYPHKFPNNWQVSSWTQQWFKLNSWEREFYNGDFYTAVQSRRYGGDLQGLIDKLDYLSDLGINALYLNPLNYSASLHKYDASNYVHIDPTLGPNPQADIQIIESEDVLDPSTWKFTSADSLFLKLIDLAHQKNIRVVLDYSWNHTGVDHPLWEDILKNQGNSKYADLYEIESFDDPTTEQNEFKYTGWAGVQSMPELKKVDVVNRVHGKPYSGNIHPTIKKHIFDVSQRWLDPYNNGDFSKGVDGYRLDVADQIGMDFWKEYRTFVRSVNPECYLIGEIWWEKWPEKMMDPRPYMQGDIFDAVMHYQWYKPARALFALSQDKIGPSQFAEQVNQVFAGYKDYSARSMMNMSSSHDAPRLSSSFFNPNTYKKVGRSNYLVSKPDTATVQRLKLFLAHQYTYVGSPQIYQGDEMGMWGGDDPDNRKPLIWDDMVFENENLNSRGEVIVDSEVKFDSELFNFYKKLIKIRKENAELIYGTAEFVVTDDHNQILAYFRSLADQKIYVIFNLSDQKSDVSIELDSDQNFRDLFSGQSFSSSDKKLITTIDKMSFRILKLVK